MLLPAAQTPVAVASLFCVNFDPTDPLIDLYTQAATQFNADNDPSLASLIVVSLMNRLTLYHKTSCMDCAQGQSVSTNLAGAENTESDINLGLSVAGQLTSSIPIAGQIEGIISEIAGIFGQAHAQAVVKEQAVNCAAASEFNKYIPQIDAAVASGRLDAQTGIQTAQQIIDAISGNLDSVVKAHNWGWGAQQVLQAQLWFRQQWYPVLENSESGLGASGSSGLLLLALLFGAVLLAGSQKKSA